MSPLVAVVALVGGYVLGSVSWARILGRDVDFSRTEIVVSEGGEAAALHGASPAMLGAHRGVRWGIVAALLDIGKAVAAVLVARALTGDDVVAALAGVGAVTGHIYPLWHRLRGGYGISPMVGASAALDPELFGLAMLLGIGAGTVLGNAWAMTKSWPIALAGLSVWRRDPALMTFALVGGGVHVHRGWEPTAAALRSLRVDRRPWRERVRDARVYPIVRATDEGS